MRGRDSAGGVVCLLVGVTGLLIIVYVVVPHTAWNGIFNGTLCMKRYAEFSPVLDIERIVVCVGAIGS